MILFFRSFLIAIMIFSSTLAYSEENIVNVYTWSEEIPDEIISQFEQETGIKVNYTTYDSNEMMYTKIRTNRDIGYDIVEPSSYYILRMAQQGMLEPLDASKLPNKKHLDPFFTDPV